MFKDSEQYSTHQLILNLALGSKKSSCNQLSGISKFAGGDDFLNSNINGKGQPKFENNLLECSYLLRKIAYINLF
jgi:hypothetical protein